MSSGDGELSLPLWLASPTPCYNDLRSVPAPVEVQLTPEATSLPNTYESMYRRALLHSRRGEPEAAIETMQRILRRLSSLSSATLERHPELSRLAVTTALAAQRLLRSLGRYDEAVAAMEALQKCGLAAGDALERVAAQIRLQKGELEEAHQALCSLTERFPYDPAHWQALGQAEAAHGRYQEARQAFVKALEVAPGDADRAPIWRDLLRLFAAEGETQEALQAWEELASLDQDLASGWAGTIYRLLFRSGEFSQLRQRLAKDPELPRVEFYRALLDYQEGDFAGGRRRWEKVVQMNPFEYQGSHLEWAEAALRTGAPTRAILMLTASDSPRDASRRLLLLGIATAMGGEANAAKRFLETGVRGLAAEVPRRTLYSQEDRELLTSLVDDRSAWDVLRPFFVSAERA